MFQNGVDLDDYTYLRIPSVFSSPSFQHLREGLVIRQDFMGILHGRFELAVLDGQQYRGTLLRVLAEVFLQTSKDLGDGHLVRHDGVQDGGGKTARMGVRDARRPRRTEARCEQTIAARATLRTLSEHGNGTTTNN